MDNKTTGILAIVVIIAVIGGYFWWESTRSDGQTTLENANPNAPAITEPSAPGGAPAAPTGTAPAPATP
jgi:hypothetical protein